MQRSEIISEIDLFKLVDFDLSGSGVTLFESYSEYEKEIIVIKYWNEFIEYFQSALSSGRKDLGFAIYYPRGNGQVSITKVELNPKYCNGKTFRYRAEGWGLIFLHVTFLKLPDTIKCSISANSEKRAVKWKEIIPTIDSPDNWNWAIVESNTRKLISRLKKYAKQDMNAM